jgi:hypothetical protein
MLNSTRRDVMRRLPAVLLGLGLGLASNAFAEEKAGPAPRAGGLIEEPRGTCHFTGRGVTVTIEDTTNEACRERQRECAKENPGREAECRSRWVLADKKAKAAVKKVSVRKAEKKAAAKSAPEETPDPLDIPALTDE